MKLTVTVPDDWAPRRRLMNDLKVLGDRAHDKARSLNEKITIVNNDEPNETQESVLRYAAEQRTLGDVLHELATQIERA